MPKNQVGLSRQISKELKQTDYKEFRESISDVDAQGGGSNLTGPTSLESKHKTLLSNDQPTIGRRAYQAVLVS